VTGADDERASSHADGAQTPGSLFVFQNSTFVGCRLLQVPPPDLAGRAAIFGVHTRGMPVAPDVCLDKLATASEGFTGAAIAACCREAALAALEDSLDATCVSLSHFTRTLRVSR
jgi:SpoVK/Ycf46/Vps4 family AAA+-type ATPase